MTRTRKENTVAIDQAEKKGHPKKKRFLFIYAYIVAILLILSTVELVKLIIVQQFGIQTLKVR